VARFIGVFACASGKWPAIRVRETEALAKAKAYLKVCIRAAERHRSTVLKIDKKLAAWLPCQGLGKMVNTTLSYNRTAGLPRARHHRGPQRLCAEYEVIGYASLKARRHIRWITLAEIGLVISRVTCHPSPLMTIREAPLLPRSHPCFASRSARAHPAQIRSAQPRCPLLRHHIGHLLFMQP